MKNANPITLCLFKERMLKRMCLPSEVCFKRFSTIIVKSKQKVLWEKTSRTNSAFWCNTGGFQTTNTFTMSTEQRGQSIFSQYKVLFRKYVKKIVCSCLYFFFAWSDSDKNKTLITGQSDRFDEMNLLEGISCRQIPRGKLIKRVEQ